MRQSERINKMTIMTILNYIFIYLYFHFYVKMIVINVILYRISVESRLGPYL